MPKTREKIIRARPELDAELRSILDNGGPERIQRGDLTREAVEAYWGLGRSQTSKRLAKLVDEGKFTEHLVMIDKTYRTVWRRVKANGKGRKQGA
jgi:Fic family protein